MYVIVFDAGDPDRVELIGPFASDAAATEWGRGALDPMDAVWAVEHVIAPLPLPDVYL